jgi:hypothetical protein
MYVPPNSEGLGTVAQELTFNRVGKHLLISDQDRCLFAVKYLAPFAVKYKGSIRGQILGSTRRPKPPRTGSMGMEWKLG